MVKKNEGDPPVDPASRVMIILVTREDIQRQQEAFRVIDHFPTTGHTACSGPHINYEKLRVPVANVLCTGQAAVNVVAGSFDFSAVLVGAMGVSIMRAAFDAALAFAKAENRGGTVRVLERQAVADLLINIKMQTDVCRTLTWKAAHCMENGPGDYNARRELALAAKVYCSDAAVKACTEAINAVGM
jgi:alkylation response protein AidB-like acyl-CoA dehydrogenase